MSNAILIWLDLLQTTCLAAIISYKHIFFPFCLFLAGLLRNGVYVLEGIPNKIGEYVILCCYKAQTVKSLNDRCDKHALATFGYTLVDAFIQWTLEVLYMSSKIDMRDSCVGVKVIIGGV